MTIKERNGKYYCKFKIQGVEKHLLCHGAKNKKEAQAIEDSEKYKLRLELVGIKTTQKDIKLNKLLNLYTKYSEVNKLSHGRDGFTKYIGIYFGKETLTKNITANKIEKFKEYLRTKRNCKSSTINKYISALSKMFNLGIENKLIDDNPTKGVKKLREDNHKVRYLTKEEEIRMFNVINDGKKVIGRDKKEKIIYPYMHIKPIIITALQTGMRKGEILNLQWNNIDFDKGYIELLHTKSGKSRCIPISKTLLNILNQQPKISNFVFINPETNEPYTDIKHSFSSLLKEADISNFRFHDLRHTAATRMADKVPLQAVKEILGHSRIETTMRYAHPIKEQLEKAISVLDNFTN